MYAGSLSSSPAQEPGNEASKYGAYQVWRLPTHEYGAYQHMSMALTKEHVRNVDGFVAWLDVWVLVFTSSRMWFWSCCFVKNGEVKLESVDVCVCEGVWMCV